MTVRHMIQHTLRNAAQGFRHIALPALLPALGILLAIRTGHPLGLTALLTTPMLTLGTLQMASHVQGSPVPDLQDAITRLIPKWPVQCALHGLAALAWLAGAVPALLMDTPAPASLAPLLATGLIATRLQFAPACHADGFSPKNSLRRSWNLTAGRTWKMLAALSALLAPAAFFALFSPALGATTGTLLWIAYTGTLHGFFRGDPPGETPRTKGHPHPLLSATGAAAAARTQVP